MPSGIPNVIAKVPTDYIYFECPFCHGNTTCADDEGIHECEHCNRKVNITGNDW